jgi:hypothetical protein
MYSPVPAPLSGPATDGVPLQTQRRNIAETACSSSAFIGDAF